MTGASGISLRGPGRMAGASRVSILFMVLLLCATAKAGLLVDVSPKDPGINTLSLYLDETGDYEISVLNDGPSAVSNVALKATASEGLKIVDSGIQKSTVSTTIDSIQPNQKQTILITLKPTELSAKRLFLYVDYGVNTYTHLSATYLEVKESPLQVNSSLSKTALDFGEEASVKLSLKNNGQEELRNIKAELIVFKGLESMDGTVSLAALAPSEGYEGKEFLFRPDSGASGEIPLVLQVSFEDSLGRHVIEKGYSVEIQSRQTILYLIAGIVVLLVFVAIVSRKSEPREVKKLEKPLVQEIEGTKVKKV